MPACPVFARVRERTPASTANDDGPAGLSTRITPVGSRPFGIAIAAAAQLRHARPKGGELGHDERGDLVDREVAREPRRLPVAAAARLPRDRGDIDAIGRGAQRDLPRRAAVARRLADQRGQLRTLDGAEDVDDSLRVRLHRPDLAEVAAEQVRDDDAALLVEHCALERPGEQLQLRELHRLVDALEHALQVGAGLEQVAASRSAFGVVFAYWNRPVSVTSPV